MGMGSRWAALPAAMMLLLASAARGDEPQEMRGTGGSITVLGGGQARACSDAAKHASATGVSELGGLYACGVALDSEPLSLRDRAATYVNRGILYICRSEFPEAIRDYDTAIAMLPTLGEAWADRGAARIAMHQYEDGIGDIEHGIMLTLSEPEKAYYNRAVAREALGDLKGAYLDFLKASQLKPDWPLARDQLNRFTVTRQVHG